jgi:hypothetical protein
MRGIYGFLGLAALAAVPAASASEYFAAALSGGQSVPANNSTADGFGRVILDDAANTVHVAVDVRSLAANYTMIALYGPAAAGATGPMLFSLAEGSAGSGDGYVYAGGGGGYGSGCGYYGCPPVDQTSEVLRDLSFPVNAAQKESLRAGQWYFAVNDATYPNGEVRGQLQSSKPYAASLNGGQVVPAAAGAGSATATVQLSPNNNIYLLSVDWSGLSGAITGAHLHGPAAPGQTAAPMATLAVTGNGNGNFHDFFYAITPENAQALKSGQLYIDLHTAAFPAGEVRGQLGTGFAIGPGISGNWYNPQQNGHGFQFEVLKDPAGFVTVFWFVFDNAGKQVWIAGSGQIDGNTLVMGSARKLGGRFPPNFNPADAVGTPWGTLTFTFTDCDHAHVDWTTTDAAFTPAGGLDIQRLTSLAGTNCP